MIDVGDLVRINTAGKNPFDCEVYVLEEMIALDGCIAHVTSCEDGHLGRIRYRLDIDNSLYMWTDDIITPVFSCGDIDNPENEQVDTCELDDFLSKFVLS